MSEHLVFVREAGQIEYDIIYVSENVRAPDGSVHPITIEDLHRMVQDALGRTEPVSKITLDEIAIRNINGIRFMFKKPEPRIEVTFEGVAQQLGGYNPQHYSQSFQAPVVPVSVPSNMGGKGDNKWLTVLDKNPFSFGHSAATINEHLFVFGGFADEVTTNHCLLLSDTHGGKFSKLRVRGDVPPPRERCSASLVGKKIYIFGGYNRGPDLYYNSLYCFESETLTWHKIEPRGTPPERRCGHSSCVIDGKMWIFGGRGKAKMGDSWFSGTTLNYTNDLHCYDPATNEWLRYEPRGIGPSGRALHSATAVGRKMYIFGGANSTGSRNDTSGFCDLYELDIDTMCWTECETKNTPPSPCYGHTATYIGDNKILFFGGKGYKVLNDLNVLELRGFEWKQYAYAGNTLMPRWGHTATLHDSRVLIFGGRATQGYYDTIDMIEINTQLIELKPEEQAKEKVKRKQEEKNREREAINNLQNAVQELQQMISQLGQELMVQQKQITHMNEYIQVLERENNTLLEKVNTNTTTTL